MSRPPPINRDDEQDIARALIEKTPGQAETSGEIFLRTLFDARVTDQRFFQGVRVFVLGLDPI